ncbi:MAG: TonB-dependent receptor [Deltaproteobacteria bacterium]|nr:TonB-dependent receptor [Deltaproteobacteria bacterium]
MFAALILVSGFGLAAAESPVRLDNLVVESSALGDEFHTGDVDPAQLTSFATVINLVDIDPGITSLGELLDKEVGVQVRGSGGLGGYSSVSLRGASGDQVYLYLDGVLLNDASGGGVNLALVPLHDIAAIEVYRGNAPVNFNRSGLGGVINLRSRRSRSGTGGSLDLGLSSFAGKRLAAALNHRPSGHFDLLAQAEYLGGDNDFKFLNNNGTTWNSADDRREKRRNNELFRRSLLVKGGYDFSDDLRLEISEQYLNQDRRLPTWNNSAAADTHFQTENHLFRTRLEADNVSPWRLNLAGQLFYGDKKETYNDAQGIIGLGRQQERYRTRKYGASLFAEWPTASQVLSFNLEAGRETYAADDLLLHRPRGDSRRHYVAAALQDSIYLFQQRLLLTPACHYQWYDDRLESAVGNFGGAIPGYRRRHDLISPVLGLRYRWWGPLTLRANWAAYGREPSFYELFGDRGLNVGNPDLKPEKGLNYDVGFNLDLPLPSVWLHRVEFESAYFYSRIDDLISRIYDARGVGHTENISVARVRGLELRAVLELGAGFRLLGNATWQKSENRGDIGAFRGRELPGRWEKSFLARLENRWGRLRSYLEYQGQSGMYYDAANLLPASAKNLLNCGLTLTLPLSGREWRLNLEAKNLNGDEYQDFNGYPMPEQEYFCNLSCRF